MRIAILIFSLLLSAFCIADETTDPQLLSELKALTEIMSDGIAVLVDAPILQKDFSSASTGAAKAVIFNIEGWRGGNTSTQYLAIYLRNSFGEEWPPNKPFHKLSLHSLVKIGSDFERQFISLEIKKDIIHLSGKAWGPNDAHCCPTVPISIQFKIESQGVREIGQ
jgi:hypothetical protein